MASKRAVDANRLMIAYHGIKMSGRCMGTDGECVPRFPGGGVVRGDARAGLPARRPRRPRLLPPDQRHALQARLPNRI